MTKRGFNEKDENQLFKEFAKERQQLMEYQELRDELASANQELEKSIARLAEEKKVLQQHKNEDEKLRAREQALGKEFAELKQQFENDIKNSEKSHAEVDITVRKLEAVQSEMREIQNQYEILCDKMEQIVKDYKAFNAEIKTLEEKISGKSEIEAQQMVEAQDLPECVDEMGVNVKKPRTDF